MISMSNGKGTREIEEETESPTDQIMLEISTSRRTLLDKKRQNKFLAMLKTFPGRSSFVKVESSTRLSSSSSKHGQEAEESIDVDIPHSFPSPGDQSSSTSFRLPFVKKINWASLVELFKTWIKEPTNMVLLLWMTCVVISGSILFLVMTGMLNGALPRKSQRDTWFEVNNQILNALFTLMCLYQHPKRFHHLVLLCRWRQEDIVRLRNIYCKNGTRKPNERMHMLVVVALLHVNCFAQYALCGLNWGYPRSERPAIGVGICISVAIGAPAIASLYNIVSPLGKEYTEIDEESQGSISSSVDQRRARKRYSFMAREAREDLRPAETSPRWVGGLFDFWDDISLAYLSVFCSCCVFGWNMDRLRFGNMYVHVATFLLFCLAPFFIFNLAAVNIDNETVREALGITGFLLCIFGLLYGGFWRIQMRKKFNLPPNTFCCGEPSVTDCFQWLCCCSCSLAQEVRTADYYDVVEDKLYVKELSNTIQPSLSPLPREAGTAMFKSNPAFASEMHAHMVEEDAMRPPLLSGIQR
ncbi:unnamed protein product [Musa acuminata subsp. burmannicoides]